MSVFVLGGAQTDFGKVDTGHQGIVLAGGVESVSRVPMFSDDGPLYSDPRIGEQVGFVHMGVAADLVATLEASVRTSSTPTESVPTAGQLRRGEEGCSIEPA